MSYSHQGTSETLVNQSISNKPLALRSYLANRVLLLYGSGTSTCICRMSFSGSFILLISTHVLLHVRKDFCSCFAFYIPSYFSPALYDGEWRTCTRASGSPTRAPASAWDCRNGSWVQSWQQSRLIPYSIYYCWADEILKSSDPLALDALLFSFFS